jgi:pantothenate kinase
MFQFIQTTEAQNKDNAIQRNQRATRFNVIPMSIFTMTEARLQRSGGAERKLTPSPRQIKSKDGPFLVRKFKST